MTEPIPLVDLSLQHAAVADAVRGGFERVMDRTAFVLGEEVSRFERDFAAFCGTSHCVGVANGTDALELALRAVGVGVGDEVVVPANTFIATAEAVTRAGATPVLVDCDPVHYLIDPAGVADRIGPRTAAVMPVHLYGQTAPMDALEAVLDGADILLVEDAAQAQGARRRGRPAGSLGTVAGTSFYPGKNLGAYGDAGAVLTGSDEVAQRLRALRNHGGETTYEHGLVGCNSRLDTLQAVVLDCKLAHLDDWNAERVAAAERYSTLLADVPEVVAPQVLDGNDHVWHLYVIRVPERDAVRDRLNAQGIGAKVHYPTPVHLAPGFAFLGHSRGDFPVAEQASDEILSLPLYPGITAAQQERVVTALAEAVRQ